MLRAKRGKACMRRFVAPALLAAHRRASASVHVRRLRRVQSVAGPGGAYVAADRATYEALAPEYAAYVAADPALADENAPGGPAPSRPGACGSNPRSRLRRRRRASRSMPTGCVKHLFSRRSPGDRGATAGKPAAKRGRAAIVRNPLLPTPYSPLLLPTPHPLLPRKESLMSDTLDPSLHIDDIAKRIETELMARLGGTLVQRLTRLDLDTIRACCQDAAEIQVRAARRLDAGRAAAAAAGAGVDPRAALQPRRRRRHPGGATPSGTSSTSSSTAPSRSPSRQCDEYIDEVHEGARNGSDKETRRGKMARNLSPCLLVSLSPCRLVTLSPLHLVSPSPLPAPARCAAQPARARPWGGR